MDSVQSSSLNKGSINQVSLLKRLEPFICLAIIGSIFGYLGSVMGLTNMINTMMNTAHQLLLNTVFFIMGITVMAGALSRILIEHGVVNAGKSTLSLNATTVQSAGQGCAGWIDDILLGQPRNHQPGT